MSPRAAKKPPLFTRMLERGLHPRLLIGAAAIGVVVYGGYALWRHVEPAIHTHPQYKIDLDTIAVTPQPSWIRSDVKAEVLRDGSFDQDASLLDDTLAERVASAFALHPWVAQVVQVRKTGSGGVHVELEYRRPVCMVEVPGGLYAVDARGVLLPSSDFLPIEARRYPRLAGVHIATAGPVGTAWPDVRVQGAAEIADSLGDLWRDLELNRIVPVSASGETSSAQEPEFELFTVLGTRVRWGKAPHAAAAGEPRAEEKIARLSTYAAERGTLDGLQGPQDIDLRARDGIIATPRVAVSPDEPADTPQRQ